MTITRVAIAAVLVLSILAAPFAAEAQRATKMPRLGYLSPLSASNPYPPSEAFWQGLRDLGWVAGQSIAIEWRFAEGKAQRLADLAAELVRLRVDLILAETTPAARAAKQATTTIPIVFSPVADSIGSGLVANLARPGGNITGWFFLATELTGKRLELLEEAVPAITRVGVLSHPGVPSEAARKSMFEEAEAAAWALGVQLRRLEAQGPNDIDRAFATMSRERVGGLIFVPSGMFVDERRRIVELAAKAEKKAEGTGSAWRSAGSSSSYMAGRSG